MLSTEYRALQDCFQHLEKRQNTRLRLMSKILLPAVNNPVGSKVVRSTLNHCLLPSVAKYQKPNKIKLKDEL